MNFFFIVSFLTFFGHCNEKSDFQIVKSEYQTFAGGTVMSPSGINYSVELLVLKKLKDFQLGKIWVGKKVMIESSFILKQKVNNVNVLSKGDTLYISMSKIHYPDYSGMDNSNEQNTTVLNEDICPVEYDGTALICYTVKGRERFLIIPSFARLDPILRP